VSAFLTSGISARSDILDSKIKQADAFIDASQAAADGLGKHSLTRRTILTGFSLGGLLAQMMGAKYQLTSITYNGPYVPVTLARKYNIPLTKDPKHHNFSRSGDPVGVGEILGTAVVPRHEKQLDTMIDVLRMASNALQATPFHQHFLGLTKRSLILDKSSLIFLVPTGGEVGQLATETQPHSDQSQNQPSSGKNVNENHTSSAPKEFGKIGLISLDVSDEPANQNKSSKEDSSSESQTSPSSSEENNGGQTGPGAPAGQQKANGSSIEAGQGGQGSRPAGELKGGSPVSPTGDIPVIKENNNGVSKGQTQATDNPRNDSASPTKTKTYTEEQWQAHYLEGLIDAQRRFFERVLQDPPDTDPVDPGVRDPDPNEGVVEVWVMPGRLPTADPIIVTLQMGTKRKTFGLRFLMKPDVDPWPTDFHPIIEQTSDFLFIPPNVDPVDPAVRSPSPPEPSIPIGPIDRATKPTEATPSPVDAFGPPTPAAAEYARLAERPTTRSASTVPVTERSDQASLAVSCNLRSSWLEKLDVANTRTMLLIEHIQPAGLDKIIDALKTVGWKSFSFKSLTRGVRHSEVVMSEVTKPDLVILVRLDGENWQEQKLRSLLELTDTHSNSIPDFGYKIVTFNTLVRAKNAVNVGLAPELYGRAVADELAKRGPFSWSVVSVPADDLSLIQARVLDSLLAGISPSQVKRTELDPSSAIHGQWSQLQFTKTNDVVIVALNAFQEKSFKSDVNLKSSRGLFVTVTPIGISVMSDGEEIAYFPMRNTLTQIAGFKALIAASDKATKSFLGESFYKTRSAAVERLMKGRVDICEIESVEREAGHPLRALIPRQSSP
jgi:hypothetical protein